MTDTKYELSEDIVSRTNQDGTVIIMKMDDSNNFYKINGVAAEIWTGLSAQKNMDIIIANILTQYNVTEEVLKNDAESLLKTLVQKQLLTAKNA
jgi:transcriptional regulator CtsR